MVTPSGFSREELAVVPRLESCAVLPRLAPKPGARTWGTWQQVKVFRHDHIPVNAQTKAAAHAFQSRHECGSRGVRRQVGAAVIAAERDEVALAGVMEALQSPGHEETLAAYPV